MRILIKILFFIALCNVFFFKKHILKADVTLPQCIGNSADWTDCRGAFTKGLTSYVGEFKNGLPDGLGTFTYSDGATYHGYFKVGKEHGFGTFRCWQHGSEYVGEFKNGEKDGKGLYTYPDGVVYSGDWKLGKRHGIGTLTYLNGEVVKGKFLNDYYIEK